MHPEAVGPEKAGSRHRVSIVSAGGLLLLVSASWFLARHEEGMEPVVPGEGDTSQAAPLVMDAPAIPIVVGAIPAGDGGVEGLDVARPREESPGAAIGVSELSAEDRKRLSQVDAILSQAGRGSIPRNARIAVDDLETFRTTVDRNRAEVMEAERQLTKRADSLLARRRQEVVDKIAAGVTDGLPVKGRNNRLSRTHPYEAITEQEIAGQRYVIRVHPNEDPQLAKAGEDHRDELRRQLSVCDSLVRGLFVIRK